MQIVLKLPSLEKRCATLSKNIKSYLLLSICKDRMNICASQFPIGTIRLLIRTKTRRSKIQFIFIFQSNLKFSNANFSYNSSFWTCQKFDNLLTFSLSSRQRKTPIEVGISKNSMVGFEGQWAHNNFWNFYGPEVGLIFFGEFSV